MPGTTKSLTITDLNLISGSDETLRTAIGGFYEVVSGTYGEELEATEVDHSGFSYSPVSNFFRRYKL